MNSGVLPEDFDNLEGNTGLANINSLEDRLALITPKKLNNNDERTLNSSLSDSISEKIAQVDISDHQCYELLLTCKRVIGNKQYRVEMINDLSKCHDSELDYLHESQILTQITQVFVGIFYLRIAGAK